MKIKSMKKLPQMSGRVPLLYDREVIAMICEVSNAQSKAIDYLYQVICEQQKEIEALRSMLPVGGNEEVRSE